MYCPYCGKIRTRKIPTSLEHVVPKSIGGPGEWVIQVCKPCNSVCGNTVDSGVVNNLIMDAERVKWDIRGQSGKPPTFSLRGFIQQDDGGLRQASYTIFPDGRADLSISPMVVRTPIDEKTANVQIRASSEVEFLEIIQNINRKQRRKSLPEVDVAQALENAVVTEYQPEISAKYLINTGLFQRGLVTMAYGLGWKLFGRSFTGDAESRLLRKFFREPSVKKREKIPIRGRLWPNNEDEKFESILAYGDWHVVAVHNSGVMGISIVLFGSCYCTLRLGEFGDKVSSIVPRGQTIIMLCEPASNVVRRLTLLDYIGWKEKHPPPPEKQFPQRKKE